MIHKGFTLVEVIIVITIVTTLVGFTSLSLLSKPATISLDSTLTTLIADIRLQQSKAMSGDTEGRASPDYYGIHFDTTSYTLFHGNSYLEGDPDNTVQEIDTNLELSTSFSQGNIIFIPGSGEILNYTANTNSLSLSHPTTSNTKTIIFNAYGIIIQSE